MKQIDTSKADEEFKREYRALIKKYGDDSRIPKDEKFHVSEKYRAMCVIRMNDGVADPQVLSHYSVAPSVIKVLCGDAVSDDGLAPRKPNRRSKRRAIEEWVDSHIGDVVTPQEVADAGEVSYATAIKFINENVGTFVKAGRGKYEIKDARAEREAEKAAQKS